MKLLTKKSNVLSHVQLKLKLFKSSNLQKQKLTFLNEISNDLCQIIDTSSILYNSKLYIQQRTIFMEIINHIQHQFNLLNTDEHIYNQSLQMYYLQDQHYIDIDRNDNQTDQSKDFLKRFEKQLNVHYRKENELDEEDRQFLKMLISDYELRYFINKSEGEKEHLQGLQMMEQHILQQMRQLNIKNKKQLLLKREDFKLFEVPPDAFIEHMTSVDRHSNSIVLDVPSSVQAFLLKNCLDPKLRLQLFKDFLDTNKSNESLLNQLIEVRDQFANNLGFQDYQQYQFALNSKFFHSTKTSTKMFLLQSMQKSSKLNAQSDSNSMGGENHQRDMKITIQRILNSSVERCHKRMEALFADEQFYSSLLQKANYKSSKDSQPQIQYSDLIYLRQKILATPLYKFTLKWHQAFSLLNEITSRFLNVEFRECPPPKNHFYNHVCDIDSVELATTRQVHPSDEFKKDNKKENEKEEKVNEKNIKCFDVIQKQSNGNEKIKGKVFIDFNAYEDAKTCFSSGYCEINNFKQLPCLLIRMNFKVLDSQDDMTFDNFQTLMHEVGHSLHSILNRHRYQLLANNYKIDYAEICAKVFENLVFLLPQNNSEKAAQQSQSQSATPEFISQKPFSQYMELFRIMSQLEQVYYAKLDLFLNEKHPDNSPTLKEFSSLIQKNIFKSLIPNNDNHWFCNLSHLEEYSGLYFSYAVGEEVFNELQDKQDSFKEQQSFLQNLFTTAHQ